jgi:hypothetical protein
MFDMGPMSRAKMRRFLLKMQQQPRLWWLFTASILACAVFLGSSLFALFLHYSASGVAVTPDLILSTRTGTSLDNTPEMRILIDSISAEAEGVKLPSNEHFNMDLGYFPEFGDLNITIFEEVGARRFIVKDYHAYETTYRDPDQDFDDDVDEYYFNDDDYLRGLDTAYDPQYGNIDNNKVCRKIAEHEFNFQNCNSFHEFDRLDPATKLFYLNAGSYREVFSMEHTVANQSEILALKDISYEHDIAVDNFEFVRMDAIVAERLSASPRTYDIYGYCGLGILSEYFYHGDIEEDVVGGKDGYMTKKSDLHDKAEVKPQNNLTGIEKLVLSLNMAESLADLHGYANGLIVHDDVQLSQFLFNKDKTRLKLNDFNRAEFPLFDEENNEYCHYTNGNGHGNWRSPEEYKDDPLTEQIDVWSLGNNMYTLLTGLNPIYTVRRDKEFTKLIINGTTAFIDPRYKQRSPAEAKLAELIPRCFRYKAEDRSTIFEIVSFLSDAVAETLDHGMTREKVLQGVKTEL